MKKLVTNNNMSILVMIMLMLSALFAANASAAPNYLVTDLGTFGQSRGLAINDSGQVTGFSTTTNGDHAFLYSVGTITDLGTLGGNTSYGRGINSSGQVTGWSAIVGYTPYHAFLYSAGTMTDLGTLGGSLSIGSAINDSGQVTGWSITTNGATHAFLYSSGTMTDLGTLGGNTSYGNGINSWGQVTGLSFIVGDTIGHAFLYSAGTITDLGILEGGTSSFGRAINDSGQVTGVADIAGGMAQHAFLYSAGTMTDLGTLGGNTSDGWDINNSGQVVGTSGISPSAATAHAFLYSGGIMYDLNDLIPSSSGWILSAAAGINNYGQITGGGTINGVEHAFLLTPWWAAPVTTDTIALGPQVEVTFSNDVSSGTITAVLVMPRTIPAPPTNFMLLNGTSYDITSDASFSTVKVCIGYDPNIPDSDAIRLQLIHWNVNHWETSNPPQPVDTINKKVCGVFSSLSPFAVAEPTSVPFSTLSDKLRIHAGPPPSFDLNASFTLGESSDGIDPLAELVALQVGTYSMTIPAGSFQQLKSGSKKGTYVFSGIVNGVTLSLQMVPPSVTGDGWNFKVSGIPVDLTGLSNPVTVVITIGNDSGVTAVNALY